MTALPAHMTSGTWPKGGGWGCALLHTTTVGEVTFERHVWVQPPTRQQVLVYLCGVHGAVTWGLLLCPGLQGCGDSARETGEGWRGHIAGRQPWRGPIQCWGGRRRCRIG
jgi:hypothetical protein